MACERTLRASELEVASLDKRAARQGLPRALAGDRPQLHEQRFFPSGVLALGAVPSTVNALAAPMTEGSDALGSIS
jgi:hypothetical protein